MAAAGAIAGGRVNFEIHLESLSAAAWEAGGLDLSVDLDGAGPARLTMLIDRLDPPWPLAPLTDVSLQCLDFSYSAAMVACADGTFRLTSRQHDVVHGKVTFEYRHGGGALTLAITELALAGGRLAIRGRGQGRAWSFELQAVDVDAAAIPAYLQESSGATPVRAHGRLRGDASVSGHGGELSTVRWAIIGQGVEFSAAEGRYAANGLNLRAHGHWQSVDCGFAADIALGTGQLYLEPLFWEIPVPEGVVASVTGRLDGARLHVERLQLRDPGTLVAQGGGTIRFEPELALEQAAIEVTGAAFPAAYTRYLQPFFAGTMLGNLQTGGSVAGRLEVVSGAIEALELDLGEVRLDDQAQRFGIRGMNGELAWSRDQVPRTSRLRWDRAHLYKLPLGPADLTLHSRGGKFRLAREARIPLLDGAVVIERLEGRGLGTEDPQWSFDGLLTPVSMEALSGVLEWPLLSGKLSGVIPGVRYRNRRLDIGGALLVRIFDGDIAITRLRIDDPFGTVPRVLAEVDIRELDLMAVTRTFDVGKIEGKVSGWIAGLQLDAWQPTAFDARIATPLGDKSRHRISQRAVENLSALGGGGASAAISKGFLSMFKEFRYSRLGIRCRLRDGVCEMDGVAPADDGYYLVEGQGLPRIDIIGHTRQVDWDDLLARLKAAMQSDGPVIE